MKTLVSLVAAAAAFGTLAAEGPEDGFMVTLGGPAKHPAGYMTTTASGSFSSSGALGELFDFSRDFYIETVQRLDRTSEVNSIAGFADIDQRFLRGPIQSLWQYGGGTKYMYNGSVDGNFLRWPRSESHHVIAISTSQVFRVYVDGDLKFTQNYRSDYEKSPYSPRAANKYQVSVQPHHDVRLYRVGYLDGTGAATPEALVAKHYNGGRPLAFAAAETGRLVDIHENDFTPTSMVNRVTGAVLTAAASLTDEISWNAADPYARYVSGEGAPTRAPRFARQFYQDTASGRWYRAFGNQSPSDWRAFAYAEDFAKVGPKAPEGISLAGTGNVEIPSVQPYREVVDVTTYGAMGDGKTDDAAALAAAIKEAKASGKGVYLPKTASGGTYLVSSPLVLEAGAKLTGEPGVTVKGTGGAVLTVAGGPVQLADFAVVASDVGIKVADAKDVRIANVRVSGGKTALSLVRAEDVSVEDSVLSATDACVALAGSKRVSLRSLAIAGAAAGVAFGAGNGSVQVTGNRFTCVAGVTGAAANEDLIVAHNVFADTGATDVSLSGAARVIVRSNVLGGDVETSGSTSVIVSGNIEKEVK